MKFVAFIVLFLIALGATLLMVDENAHLDTRDIVILGAITGLGYYAIMRLFPKDDE